MNSSFLICFIGLIINLLFFNDCTEIDVPEWRIHSGKMTTELLPYQVLIFALTAPLTEDGKVTTKTCSGSLITVNYVLTAASCIDGAFTAQLIFGAHYFDRTEETQVIMATTVLKPHIKWYLAKESNDIGLIRLPESIKLVDKVIGLVKLPPKSKESPDYEGILVKASGWGLTNDDPFPVHFFLKDLNVTVVSIQECKKAYPQIDTKSTFCGVGQFNGTPCDGDQGAPLVVEMTNTQIGIASYGGKTCVTMDPYVFTKIADYLEWIELNSDYKS